jgi:hypothetical protein
LAENTRPTTTMKTLDEIDKIITDLEQKVDTARNPCELPDPDMHFDLASKGKDVGRQVRHADGVCKLHVWHFKRANLVKLALLLKGYQSAGQAQNPYVAYHFARAVLEMAAVFFEVGNLLFAARAESDGDWQPKARSFLTAIARGRYGTTDPDQIRLLESADPRLRDSLLLKRFQIKKNLDALEKSDEFRGIAQEYNRLNNYVHPNCSSLLPSVRGTIKTRVVRYNGYVAQRRSEALTQSYEYPPRAKTEEAVTTTAGGVLKYAQAILRWSAEMPDTPFTEDELMKLTGSQSGGWRVVRAPPILGPAVRLGPKVGRNDPCPCGSGRKYKHCCGN